MSKCKASYGLSVITATLGLVACTDHMTVGYRDPVGNIDGGHDAATPLHDAATRADVSIGCNEEIRLAMDANQTPIVGAVVAGARACEVAIDPSDARVTACASSDPTTVGVSELPLGQSKQLFVEKRTADGALTFHTAIAGLTPISVASDSVGNTLVLAIPEPASDQNPSFALVKLTATGTVAWNKTYNKMRPGADALGALDIAADGSIWVTGSMNFLLAHFDAAGNQLETLPLGADQLWGPGQAVRILGNAEVLLAGVFQQTLVFDSGTLDAPTGSPSAFVARFSSSGEFVSGRVLAADSGVNRVYFSRESSHGVVVGGSGLTTPAVVGCSISPGYLDSFVARLSGDLTVNWVTLVPTLLGAPAVSPQGKIRLPVKGPDAYLITLDATGSSGTMRVPSAGYAVSERVVTDSAGTAHVSGDFETSVTLGSLQLSANGAAAYLITVQP